MKQHLLKLVFAVLFLNLLVCGFFSAVVPARAVTSAAQPEIVVQINIPGVTFECTQQPGKLCVRSFGEYISGFYRFFAGAISIIAAVIVMWGGVKWATASGNASRAKDAKDTIYSAIIALVITFGSYVLLYTINPQIVKLELPDVNSIVGIQQGGGGCSDFTLSSIDTTSGCNPKTTECCGQFMKVNLGGGKTDTCTWDVCNNLNDRCMLEFDKNHPRCVTVEELCVSMEIGDKRGWCSTVDSYLRQTKMLSQDKTQFQNKFLYTSCGFLNKNQSNQCLWNVTLSKFFTLFPRLPSDLSAFQPKFISCYTQGAKGVCWDEVNGQPQPLNCAGNPASPCADPNTVPRPVAGAAGGCLVKTGRDGSANKDDYYCWAVPAVDINTQAPGGFGSPPSF